jgi:hypothetical protein
MAKLKVNDHVRIRESYPDIGGRDATVWGVDGDEISVKYKFLGACIPDLVVIPHSEVIRKGTGGPCPVQRTTAFEAKPQYCCQAMQHQLEEASEDEQHVHYSPQDDETSLINREDADYVTPISFCPWCGKRIGPDT